MKLQCRAVGILWQEKRVLATIYIGYVHAAVSTNQAVLSFSDENATFPADHAFTLLQGEFGDPSIEMIAASPSPRTGRWCDRCQFNKLSLGFGNDLVLDHENIALR